jgi:glycerophosphoryl diester phosphodiesterase
MDWLTERPIAHRGLHTTERPENSLAAFEHAVETGYPAELDVRLTSDGVPVVFHDECLDRLTDRSGRVDETAWETLADTTLLDTDEPVPTLDDVLTLVDGAVPLLVELKSSGQPTQLARAVAATLDAYDGAFAVQSFDPRLVFWCRRHRPAWTRGQLAGLDTGQDPVTRFLVNRLLSNALTRPDFVGYRHDALPYPPVARYRERCHPVLAWTITTDSERRTVELFADNIIFEETRP